MVCAGIGFAGSGEVAEARRGVQQSAASKARMVVACKERLCWWLVFMDDVNMENGGFLWFEVWIVIFIGF
jgi:hypothetical protein